METNSERVAYQEMLRECERSLFGDDDEQEEELEECEQ